jgi:hypothetical protein
MTILIAKAFPVLDGINEAERRIGMGNFSWGYTGWSYVPLTGKAFVKR